MVDPSRQAAHGLLLDRVSEREWQEQVLAWAKRGGWRHYHSYSSLRSPTGWPDLYLIRDTDAIAAELKRNVGRVSPAQDAWLDAHARVTHVGAHVWRPRDWQTVRDILLRR
jgi:hypothetical protein